MIDQPKRDVELVQGAAETPAAARLAAEAGQRFFTTTQLFGPGTEVAIIHGAATYRLRITRQGKLILTK